MAQPGLRGVFLVPSTATLSPCQAGTQPHTRTPEADVALDGLFEDMAPYVLRVIPRMGVARSDVDDVAQNVFMAVHRGWSRFEGRSSPRTWIYGICIRICADYRRRAARLPAMSELKTDSKPSHEPDPERQAHSTQVLLRLDRALCQLPDAQRALFVLTDIEGLSIAEASTALKCPLFTAYARLYAARKKLRVELADLHSSDPNTAGNRP